MSKTTLQLEFPFASLDFPGRTNLTLDEIANRLGVNKQTIINRIEEGMICAIDLKGRHVSRSWYRIPVESYRDYVVAIATGPRRVDLLKGLSPQALRDLRADIDTALSDL